MKVNQNQTTPANTNQSSTNSNLNSQSSASGSNTNMGGTSGKGGLGNITGKLQNFGSSSLKKVNGLSTTQKVIGGSLLALGAGWMAMGKSNQNKIKDQVGRIGKKSMGNNSMSNNSSEQRYTGRKNSEQR